MLPIPDWLWGYCWRKEFLCLHHVSTHWQDWWSKGEEKPLTSQKYGTSHVWNQKTRRGVTTDNFFTSCELANLLLTKNMTLVGTLWKNKPEIPYLFLSGKQSIFGFTNDLTLVSYVPARKKAVILLSSQCDYEMCMGEEKITKLKPSCTPMPIKVCVTFWTSLWGKTLIWNQQGADVWNYFQLEWCCLCKCISSVDAEKS